MFINQNTSTSGRQAPLMEVGLKQAIILVLTITSLSLIAGEAFAADEIQKPRPLSEAVTSPDGVAVSDFALSPKTASLLRKGRVVTLGDLRARHERNEIAYLYPGPKADQEIHAMLGVPDLNSRALLTKKKPSEAVSMPDETLLSDFNLGEGTVKSLQYEGVVTIGNLRALCVSEGQLNGHYEFTPKSEREVCEILGVPRPKPKLKEPPAVIVKRERSEAVSMPDETSVADFELSTRTENAMRMEGAATLGDLRRLYGRKGMAYLNALPNFGKKSEREVIELLGLAKPKLPKSVDCGLKLSKSNSDEAN